MAEGGRIAAGADDRTVEVGASLADGAIGMHGDAVRGDGRLAVGRGMAPAIELPAGQPVGGAQRLDRRGIGHQREARHEQEADGVGWRSCMTVAG